MKKTYYLQGYQLGTCGLKSPTDKTKPMDLSYIWGNFKINEKVDFDKLKEAINYCIEKNDGLRVKYCYEKGVLKQYFADYKPIDIEIIDLKDEAQIQDLQENFLNIPIDMIENYLYNIKMYRLPNGHGGVILKINHSAIDGWSIGLVAYEIINRYIGKFVFPITGAYEDYFEKKLKYESDYKRMKMDTDYYENLFKDGIPDLAVFPQSKPIKDTYSFESAEEKYIIDNAIIKKIKEYCKEKNTSINRFLNAAFCILLSKLSGSKKFCMCGMVSNRKSFIEKFTVGMFTQLYCYVVECPNITFTEFIKNVDKSISESFKHRGFFSIPGNDLKIINRYYPDRKVGFTTNSFIYQNINLKTDKKDLNYEITGDSSPTTMGSDIVVHAFDYESENKFEITYDYSVEKYDKEDIDTYNAELLDIINQILKNKDIYIDDINIARKDVEIKSY